MSREYIYIGSIIPCWSIVGAFGYFAKNATHKDTAEWGVITPTYQVDRREEVRAEWVPAHCSWGYV